jgi:hypothetical protein
VVPLLGPVILAHGLCRSCATAVGLESGAALDVAGTGFHLVELALRVTPAEVAAKTAGPVTTN